MKSRLFSMLLTGLVLALGLYLAVHFTQNARNVSPSEPLDANAADTINNPNAMVDPIIFKSVSENDGILRLSGTGHADSQITLENAAQPVNTFTVDENGNWATSLNVDPDQRLVLELVSKINGGAKIRSDETLFRIPAPDQPEGLEDRDIPPLILLTAPGGPSRVIQSPFRTLPHDGPIRMGHIDYDASGGVIISGTSEQAGRVKIFANDLMIGEQGVEANGRWFFIATDTLPYGQTEIRADLQTGEGVVASLTLPFERSRSNSESAERVSVTYAPYYWSIQRTLLGGGQQFTVVFAPQDSEPILEE